MAKELTNLVIDEISLVDDPANEDAKVAIFKGKKKPTEGCAKSDPDMDGDDEEKDDTDGDAKVKKVADETEAIMRHVPAALEECAQLIIEKAAIAGGVSADSVAALNAASSLKEFTMDIQELSKALEDAEAKLATLEKRATDAEDIVKAKDEEIAVLKGAAAVTASDEDVIKSAPEPVQKMLLEARERASVAEAVINKMKDEQELSESITKAKDLNFGDPEKVGPLLQRIGKGRTVDGDVELIEQLLKQAGEVSKGNKLFSSIGSNGGDAHDPLAAIVAKGEEIRKSNPGMTKEQAEAQAIETDPSLYAAYLAKRRVA